MSYSEYIHEAITHLEASNISIAHEQGAKANIKGLSSISRTMEIEIPIDLVELYSELGDGIEIQWINEEDGITGGFKIPNIRQLDLLIAQRKKTSVDFDDNYTFNHVQNARLAKETAKAARRWIPIISTPMEDFICVDASTGCVRFYQHDWFDGGIGNNGHVMCEGLNQFMSKWSRRSFQHPEDWNKVLSARGINWNHEQFDKKYRIDPFIF